MDAAYKADFHTPLGRGTGVVFLLTDGRVLGGDSLMLYSGVYAAEGDRFTGEITSRRHSNVPGVTSVFGRDQTHIVFEGVRNGDTIRLSGVSPDAPGVVLDVRLVRMAVDIQGPARADDWPTANGQGA